MPFDKPEREESASASEAVRSFRMQGNPSDEKGIMADAKRQIEAARERIARHARHDKETGGDQKMAKGGVVKSSASSRADGCAMRGKTKGRMV